MSTGLTYVSIIDTEPGAGPEVSSSYVFSSYDEAYSFGDWFCRAAINLYGIPKEVYVFIYTTGPNNSGYWNGTTETPTFVDFE